MPAATNSRSEDPGRNSKLKRLLIRPGGIGDVILSLPALEHLKADYTEVWTPARTVPLIRFADRVRAISATGLDLVGITCESGALESLRTFDDVVSWYGTNRPEFREAVTGLPFTFFDALPSASEMHATEYYMRQVGGPPAAVPAIRCPRGGADFVAIHPFSGSAKKNWPLERYIELARHLDTDVRFFRGPEQSIEGAVYVENLWDLACCLASARMYIGNDSGITHLAAAVGTATVALFGPTDPKMWAPRGENVTVVAATSMESIAIEQVLQAAMERRAMN